MNQVMALNMGADEFIEKPFELTILLAKIQALLRRSYKYGQQLSYSFESINLFQQSIRFNQQMIICH